MKLKKHFSNKKGVILSDALLSILIIILFSGVIFSIMTNTVRQTKIIKIKSQQLDYVVSTLEYAQKIKYDEVTVNKIAEYINSPSSSDNGYLKADHPEGTATTEPYKMTITIEPDSNYTNYAKTVTVKVTSTLNNKEYSTELSKKIIKVQPIY